MAAHSRRLKEITFTLGGTAFQCQVNKWQLTNATETGDRKYGFCPDSQFFEETDPDWSLELTFFSDWRSGGISDYLAANDGATVAFVLDHHPDIVAEHVRWSGNCLIKAPNVGGEARTTEVTEVTLPVLDEPTYTRV
jgi:hypothetical protein